MSNAIAVIAKSGFGKSTAYLPIPELGIRGLNPAETLVINVKGKPLPSRGWKKLYTPVVLDPLIPPTTGNYFASTNHADIIKIMKYFDGNRPEIKNILIDDSQYLMAEEFMTNALKAGYEKFSKMAKNMYDVINTGVNLSHRINFIILAHQEKDNDGELKMKTIGKMLDEKVTLEGLFTVILYGKESFNASTKVATKEFVTNYDGQYPAKSPVGMFKDMYIPNDLGFVIHTMAEYYSGD